MAVCVVVPWRPGDAHREAAWRWVSSQYAEHHPDWQVVTGSCPDGPWVKALAVDDAITRTDADRLVIADADVWCAGTAEAVAHPSPVVIPHGKVHRLTESATAKLIAGERGHHATVKEPRRGMAGGGILILDRDIWDRVPMDPRFHGWGQEDSSWATALSTLTGKITRYSHPLLHLWHPPQERMTRAVGSPESAALNDRYDEARGDPAAMSVLLDEARTALRRDRWLSQPSTTSRTALVAP